MFRTHAQSLLARAGKAGGHLIGGAVRLGEALWSRSARERLLATGAFVALALFAVASLDFLVNGGPDWSQNAEAAPYVSGGGFVTLSALPDAPYVAPADLPPAAEEEALVVHVIAGEELLGGPLEGDWPAALEAGGGPLAYDSAMAADPRFTMQIAPF